MNKRLQSKVDQINEMFKLNKEDEGYFSLSVYRPGTRRVYTLVRRANGNSEIEISAGLYASEMHIFINGFVRGFDLGIKAFMTNIKV